MNDKAPIQEVLDLLNLEKIEENIFRGASPKDRVQRVFGGQVLGQALVAAARTVEGRLCHSLHAYFLRAGDPKVPILYEVDRSRDGASFTARRVVAIQHGRQIFNLAASFQLDEPGYEHEFPMPVVPAPETLPTEEELRAKVIDRLPEEVRAWFSRPRPIETRPVDPREYFSPDKRPPHEMLWIRATGALPDDLPLHQCVLAYASDMSLLDTGLLPHGIGWFDNKVQMASLDHAMWFHRPFRVDEWLLYVQDSPSASGARSFNRGLMYTRDGKLVASVAQEGLMRPRGEKKS
ncbi:MAG: acyl-CoA thioesterase II [Alphaproteobacteria bacterium]|nr:acyl-CoA thioesterase II [Alphaproteobacteria bacterium]MDE1986255.1 acyl-CoA thioesterase II [Alphaproteobacteria bacterium]MDE2162689.1 acyl-CoA thioesterase II [Alphaproteobacteria bacterium]MDE2500812.1 acyl-CoA thioesterase II [Alphaproteobacteria bacterium]